jgi:uncharacterized membrane protein YccC
MRAIRATVVVPGVFAFAEKVIGNRQVATFAAFGGFATLVLASFGGTRRDKLIAHTALAIAGSVLLTIGTAVTSSTALAAIVTVPVTFAVFFAGVVGPNAASGVTAALLAYVLPAASPGTISMVPDRLAGWWMASVAGTVAVLLLSPRSAGDQLKSAASKLARTLADELDAGLRGEASPETLDGCIEAKRELLTQFTRTPYRPIGLATADQALSNGVETLEWCTSLVLDAIREHSDLRDALPAERELVEVAATALHDIAKLLDDGRASLDLDRFELQIEQSGSAIRDLPPDADGYREAVRLAFHIRAIGVAVRSVAADVLIATRRADPDTIANQRRRWYGAGPGVREGRLAGLASAAGIVLRHASLRSVWVVNAVRGSVAIAAAVAVADLLSVQNGFWVVLGTLSVLRTTAASTGSTALRALVGTVAGFAIGAALLLAIGTSEAALWVTLPLAVLVAAYAPGTAPFAVGQASFTIVIAVLYNLILPLGWKVGVIRIQDVALGCAVSFAVGILFWPRGLSSVVGNDLADAFRAGASYLRQAFGRISGRPTPEPSAAAPAITAALRLDDALRAFIAEQGTKHLEKQELWRLVGGTMRLRLTARSVAGLSHGGVELGTAGPALDQHAEAIADWFERLATWVAPPRHLQEAPPLEPTPIDGAGGDGALDSRQSIWLHEHLHHLSEHLHELVPPAEHIAAVRRQPWWR